MEINDIVCNIKYLAETVSQAGHYTKDEAEVSCKMIQRLAKDLEEAVSKIPANSIFFYKPL